MLEHYLYEAIDIYLPVYALFTRGKFRYDDVSPTRFSFVLSYVFFRADRYHVRHDRGSEKNRKKSNFVNYSTDVDVRFGVVSVCRFFPVRLCPHWTVLSLPFSFETRVSRGRIFCWTSPLNRSRPESHVCSLWCDVEYVYICMHRRASVARVLYVCD